MTSTSTDKFHINNHRMDYCFTHPDSKLLFVNIPKNASTSIRKSLGLTKCTKYKDVINSKHITFTVLRNPIHRAISSYLEMSKLREDGPYYVTKTLLWYKKALSWYELNHITDSFITFLDEIKGNFYDPHCFPQIKSLLDKSLTIDKLDEIIIFENLIPDYNNFIEKYNITNAHLKKETAGKHNKKKRLMQFVENNKEIQNKIIDLYPDDYELYLKVTKDTRNWRSGVIPRT